MADVIMTIDSGNPLNHVGRAVLYFQGGLTIQTLAPPIETKVDVALHEAKYDNRFDHAIAVNISGAP